MTIGIACATPRPRDIDRYGAHPEWRPSALTAAVVCGIVSAAIWAGLVFLWPSSDAESLVGGCQPFNLYAQNEFEPYGTLIWAEPSPHADRAQGFAANELISVDGPVRTRSPYTTNSAPWDSNIWFHLTNDSGGVSFAGVRATQTVHDPEAGFGPGTSPSPTDSDCAGTFRP
jgi:hypothetical protein